MSRALSVAVLLAVTSISTRSAAADRSVAVALRDNVVTIEAPWKSGKSRRGFGWVVGAREDSVYIVTADHVVRGDLPGEVAARPKIRFFGDAGKHRIGELLPQHDIDLDLAIIRVPIPNRRLWRRSSLDPQPPRPGQPVFFVGKKGNWFVPERPGRIRSVDGSQILAEALPVLVGTSGAPLIGARGILGMIVSDSGSKTRVIGIDAIRERAESWAPWSLGPYQRAADIAGEWRWVGPFPIVARFERRDAAHVNFSIGPIANPREAEGTGVVDGKEIRIWNHNSMGPDSWGVLRVTYEDTRQEPPLPLVIEGRIITQKGEPTYGRIVRLGPDGNFDPRTRAYTQANPTNIESFAKQLEEEFTRAPAGNMEEMIKRIEDLSGGGGSPHRVEAPTKRVTRVPEPEELDPSGEPLSFTERLRKIRPDHPALRSHPTNEIDDDEESR